MQLNVSRFGDLLRRVMNINADNPTPDLGSQLLPIIDINSLNAPELLYLRGERWAGGGFGLGAPGATNLNKLGLMNPTGSGTIAVIREIRIYTDITGNVYVSSGGYGPGTIRYTRVLDNRFTSKVPICTVNSIVDTVPVPAAAIIYHWAIIAAVHLIHEQPLILLPGDSIWIAHATATTPSLYVDFTWTERSLGQLEAAQP